MGLELHIKNPDTIWFNLSWQSFLYQTDQSKLLSFLKDSREQSSSSGNIANATVNEFHPYYTKKQLKVFLLQFYTKTYTYSRTLHKNSRYSRLVVASTARKKQPVEPVWFDAASTFGNFYRANFKMSIFLKICPSRGRIELYSSFILDFKIAPDVKNLHLFKIIAQKWFKFFFF